MPRGKKKLSMVDVIETSSTAENLNTIETTEVVPMPTSTIPAKEKLSAKEPTALEKAMEMLMLSQVNTQQMLGTINETMNKVVDGIQKINDTAKSTVDHQIDLDHMNKSKPFIIKMVYQLDQRTIDLGDGIYEYESTGRSFKSKAEAIEFGQKQFGAQGFRIVEVEQPVSQV